LLPMKRSCNIMPLCFRTLIKKFAIFVRFSADLLVQLL